MTAILSPTVAATSDRPSPERIGDALVYGGVIALLCVISFWLITHLLPYVLSISRDDDLLGGMWAVVATIFVYRHCHKASVGAALSRVAATSVSFVLCFAYLLLFPFHVAGMAILISIGAVAVTLLGRPDDTITTGITTAVIMVVAAVSPHNAWQQPILRVVDTVVGVAVGVAASWIRLRVSERSSS